MITYKLNGTKYPFPTRWEDVTYSQYVALLRTSSLTDQISVFTGISRGTLENAEIRNLEKISITLSFLSFSPKFDKTKKVGHYFVPDDVTVQSLGQFEDLRGLLGKMPKEMSSIESSEQLADLYLHACAIYCQKLRDGKYNYLQVPQVKDELRKYSCAEVIGTGAFFLFKPLNSSPPTTSFYRRLAHRLKKWMQGLPGYQRTLDLLLPSPGSPGK